MSDDDHTVLKFRPRRLAHPSAPLAPDLPGYENEPENADEYRRRMTTNIAALAFAAILAATGVWLAMKLADLRTTQDCVLMGRTDCAHISSTIRH